MTLEDGPIYLLKKLFEKLESLEFCVMEEKSKQGISRVGVFLEEKLNPSPHSKNLMSL